MSKVQPKADNADHHPPPDYPYFGSLYIAVFNSVKADRDAAMLAVKETFGETGWAKVEPLIAAGVMEVFRHWPTPESLLYAETVGRFAEERVSRLHNSQTKQIRKCPICDSLNCASDHATFMYQCNTCNHRWVMDRTS